MKKNIKILFTGDVCLNGKFGEKARQNKEIFSAGLIKIIENNDFVVVNLEGAVTNKDNYLSESLRVTSFGTEAITYLTDRNISVFNLSNNHIFDCGVEGFNDTIRSIKENKAFYFGAGFSQSEAEKILYLEKEGITIALVAICNNGNLRAEREGLYLVKFRKSKIQKLINEAKGNADYVIISYHTGEEYTNLPSPPKKKELHFLASLNGVDIVISHHSHTIQPFFKIKKSYIFYSLGNFIFDLPTHDLYTNTEKGGIVELILNKKNITVNTYCVNIDKNRQLIDLNDNCKFPYFDKELRSGYYHKWRREAYNSIYERKNRKEEEQDSSLLKNMSIFKLLSHKRFYLRLKKITDKYSFSIYFNALLYKFQQKLLNK